MDPMPIGAGGLAGVIAVAIVQVIQLLRAKANGGTIKERLARVETKVDLILQAMELRPRGK